MLLDTKEISTVPILPQPQLSVVITNARRLHHSGPLRLVATVELRCEQSDDCITLADLRLRHNPHGHATVDLPTNVRLSANLRTLLLDALQLAHLRLNRVNTPVENSIDPVCGCAPGLLLGQE
jgi:hypothetical protein